MSSRKRTPSPPPSGKAIATPANSAPAVWEKWLIRGAAVLLILGTLLLAAGVLPVSYDRFIEWARGLTRARWISGKALFAKWGLLILAIGALTLIFRRGYAPVFAEVRDFVRDFLWAGTRRFFTSEPRLHLAALAVVILTAIVLRALHAGSLAHYDEIATYQEHMNQPMARVLTHYNSNNNHWFHSVLGAVSIRVFGHGIVAIRLPAFLAGIMMVPMTYIAGRLLHGRGVGLAAAAFVAVSAEMIHYSTNARGYTLQALFFLGSLVTAAWILRARRHQTIAWTLFVLAGFLAAYTLPTAVIGFLGVVLWTGLSLWIGRDVPHRRAKLIALPVACVFVGLLTFLSYFPIMAGYGLAPITHNQFTMPQEWDVFVSRLPGSLGLIRNVWTVEFPAALAMLLSIAAVIGVLSHPLTGRHRVPFAIALLISTAALLVYQRNVPFARAWVFAYPVAAMMVGCALVLPMRLAERFGALSGRLPSIQRAATVFAAVAVVAWGADVERRRVVANLDYTGAFRPLIPMMEYLAGNAGPNDAVAGSIPTNRLMAYYNERNGYGLPVKMRLDPIPREPGRRVWLVTKTRNFWPPFDEFVQRLGYEPEEFEEVLRIDHGVIHVSRPGIMERPPPESP